ncbi:determination of heart left/right asymmetry [Branchiostoma belcheri]|nr:determination of heart left/right asymmetry [Branchiostoma belcheri]
MDIGERGIIVTNESRRCRRTDGILLTFAAGVTNVPASVVSVLSTSPDLRPNGWILRDVTDGIKEAYWSMGVFVQRGESVPSCEYVPPSEMNVFRISRLSPPRRPNFTTTVACLLRHVYAFVTLFLLFSEADRVPGGRASGVGHAMPAAGRVNIPAILTERDAALIIGDVVLQSFLERLGYFQPVDWESTLDRSRQTIFEPEDVAPDIFSDFDPSVMVEEVEGMGRDGEPTIGVDDEEFKEAIRKFQQANNLTVTGVLDDATRNKMNEPRCGNPDHTLAKNGTKAAPLAASNITSDSFADTNATSNNATVHVEKRATEDASAGSSRKRQSVLKTWMERQEERRKKRGIFVNNYVTWRLLGEGYSSQLDADLQLAVIQQAFRMWSEVIPPLFRPDHVSHIEEVDVNLAFGRVPEIVNLLLADFSTLITLPCLDYILIHDRHSAWGGATAVRHLGCPNEFQEQEYAHAFDEAAEVHINDQIQPYTVNRPDGISLLKVAVHEIGHILGLGHHEWTNSVMQPNYAPQPYNFEIGAEDRRAVQELGYGLTRLISVKPARVLMSSFRRCPRPSGYLVMSDRWILRDLRLINHRGISGARVADDVMRERVCEAGHHVTLRPGIFALEIWAMFSWIHVSPRCISEHMRKCEERFDTVFDWVRPNRDENGYMMGVIYNTFFFSDGRYWMYENSKGRTRYGDPLLIRGGWQGIAARQIDGILHVWSRTWDVLFFFAGDSYWEYDSEQEQIYTHDANGNPFPNLISYGFPGIPDNIDTVYYNRTAGYTYFFKDHLVYQYEVERQRVSPGFPKEISEVFPGVPNNLDAAYYSYTHQTTFFLKGFDYWSINVSTAAIDGPFTVNEQWQDICKVWMWELDGS